MHSTKSFEFCTSYCVVCHDAGAGNILLSREEALAFPASRYILSGPSLTKWQTVIPQSKIFHYLGDAFIDGHCLVTGTGWSSHREHDARKMAKAKNVYCYALVDHWVNYLKRFTREDGIILPDEILVSDNEAYALAKQTFNELPISKIENHYLLAARKRCLNTPKTRFKEILYVLEPIPENWGNSQAIKEEFQALIYFREYLDKYFEHSFSGIRMRLHPSESPEKYQHWIDDNSDLNIEFDAYADIESSIANSDWVFGCESYGLMVAIECGKTVFSTIPHWAPKARLPHKKLKHIRDAFNTLTRE